MPANQIKSKSQPPKNWKDQIKHFSVTVAKLNKQDTYLYVAKQL